MKKFTKTLTALVLALVVAFAFVGCKDPQPQDTETQTFGTMVSKTVENLLNRQDGFTVNITMTNFIEGGDNQTMLITYKQKGTSVETKIVIDNVVDSHTIVTGGKKYDYDTVREIWELDTQSNGFIMTAEGAKVFAVFDELPITVKNTASEHTATVTADFKQMFTDYKTTIDNYKEVDFKDFVLELRYGKNSGKTTADLQTELETMFSDTISVKSFVEDYADKYVAALLGAGNTVKTLVNKLSGHLGLTAQDIYDMIKEDDANTTVAAPTAGQSVYDYVMGIFGQQKAKDVFDMVKQIIAGMDQNGSARDGGSVPNERQTLDFDEIPDKVMQFVNMTKEDVGATGTATDPASVADMYDAAINMLVGFLSGMVDTEILEALTTANIDKITVTTGEGSATVVTDKDYNFKSANVSYDIDVSYQENAQADAVSLIKVKHTIAVAVDTTTAVTITAPQVTPAA